MTVESPHYETTSTHNYKRTYMEKLTLKSLFKSMGLIALIILGLSFTVGLLLRCVVALFNAGYSVFGLW